MVVSVSEHQTNVISSVFGNSRAKQMLNVLGIRPMFNGKVHQNRTGIEASLPRPLQCIDDPVCVTVFRVLDLQSLVRHPCDDYRLYVIQGVVVHQSHICLLDRTRQ
ncbi:hypothetical protein D9M68_727760 [compost metagenome]